MTAPANDHGLDLLLAALISAAAVAGLVQAGAAYPAPLELPHGPAAYRPDGGQSLGPTGNEPPNALTRLNLGYRLDLKAAPAHLLAALPGLGPKTAEKARASGCLDRRTRTTLKELINEACARTSP